MFVGHYGVALAIVGGRGRPLLAAGFLAVQAVDFGFFGLSLAGIEHWRPAPELTGLNPFALTFMPYTHGLAGAAGWAFAAGLATAILCPRDRRLRWSLMIGLLVLSHWGLDLLVHRPDLPLLWDPGIKLGLSLWDRPLAAIPLEMALLFGGLALYARRIGGGPRARTALLSLTLGLLMLQAINWFGPPITDQLGFPLAGLSAYIVATVLALWNDRVTDGSAGSRSRPQASAPMDRSGLR